MRLLKTLIITLFIFQSAAQAQNFYIRPAFKVGSLNAPEYQFTRSFIDWSSGGTLVDTFERRSAFTFAVGLGVCLDWHLHKINKEMSFGVQSSPTFGFYLPTNDRYYDGMGVPFAWSIPVYGQFNYGAFSTPDSDFDRGVGIGLGLHYLHLNNNNLENQENIAFASPASWLMPSARLSYRFWNAWDLLTTFNITYSRSGTSNSGITPDFRQQYIDFSFNFQFGY